MIIFGIIVLIKNTLLVEIKNKNLNKTVGRFDLGFIGGQRWIRTTEVWDVRFTVWSIWPLWNLSVWCLEVESNHRQRDFQSLALPTELSRQKWRPKRGSNSWPPAWQAGALTKLSYWAVHKKYKIWWAFTDSNRGPIGYEPTALTTELKAHTLLGRSFPSHNACIW